MAAFDTALTPVAVTPANTSNATLFTASADTSVLVNAANIGSGTPAVRVGITPSGGSVHWVFFDVEIPVVKRTLADIGPWFLQNGDAVTVRTDTADDVTFSLSGVETS